MSLVDKVEEFFANATEEDLDKMVQEIDDMELPSYHSEGMGCGIEDNRITDRYQACQYGYETAVEDCYNDVISPLKDDLTAKSKDIRELTTENAELKKATEWIDKSLAKLGEGGLGMSQAELVNFYNEFKTLTENYIEVNKKVQK